MRTITRLRPEIMTQYTIEVEAQRLLRDSQSPSGDSSAAENEVVASQGNKEHVTARRNTSMKNVPKKCTSTKQDDTGIGSYGVTTIEKKPERDVHVRKLCASTKDPVSSHPATPVVPKDAEDMLEICEFFVLYS